MSIAYLLPSRLYCRFWNHTKSCRTRLADYTADREFHPALKIAISLSDKTLLPRKGIVKGDGEEMGEFCGKRRKMDGRCGRILGDIAMARACFLLLWEYFLRTGFILEVLLGKINGQRP